ncbi:MAG: hypothetical protein N838_03880 [Thiohalocapsa sp. PB-PSB1]|nr:MAG: hypothetical protein N838_03880 [Thiohalocapsa sp. PB-PSB1]
MIGLARLRCDETKTEPYALEFRCAIGAGAQYVQTLSGIAGIVQRQAEVVVCTGITGFEFQ